MGLVVGGPNCCEVTGCWIRPAVSWLFLCSCQVASFCWSWSRVAKTERPQGMTAMAADPEILIRWSLNLVQRNLKMWVLKLIQKSDHGRNAAKIGLALVWRKETTKMSHRDVKFLRWAWDSLALRHHKGLICKARRFTWVNYREIMRNPKWALLWSQWIQWGKYGELISKYFQNVNVAIAMAWQCSCLLEVTSGQANDQGKNQCRRVEAGWRQFVLWCMSSFDLASGRSLFTFFLRNLRNLKDSSRFPNLSSVVVAAGCIKIDVSTALSRVQESNVASWEAPHLVQWCSMISPSPEKNGQKSKQRLP